MYFDYIFIHIASFQTYDESSDYAVTTKYTNLEDMCNAVQVGKHHALMELFPDSYYQ